MQASLLGALSRGINKVERDRLLEGVDKVRGEGEAAGGEGGAGWVVGWHFYKTEEGQPGKSV